MQFDIPRVNIDSLSSEDFLRDYFLTEKPVLLVGLDPPSEQVVIDLGKQQDLVAGFGFFGAQLDTNNADIGFITPRLVKHILERDDIVIRKRPMRVWGQRKGHHTLLHYDGNSLHGLNWQISGSKLWTLISSDTPTRLYPFSPYSLVRENFQPDAQKQDFCQFETAPGDLLFLPRYWTHSVTSLEDFNTNLNWVMTPRKPNLQNKVGRRECAVLAWRKLIPGLNRLLYQASSINNYGAGGKELFRAYARALPRRELIYCLAKELANVAWLPFYHREIMRQAKRFAKSSNLKQEGN